MNLTQAIMAIVLHIESAIASGMISLIHAIPFL